MDGKTVLLCLFNQDEVLRPATLKFPTFSPCAVKFVNVCNETAFNWLVRQAFQMGSYLDFTTTLQTCILAHFLPIISRFSMELWLTFIF
jgi:hypothetical protein